MDIVDLPAILPQVKCKDCDYMIRRSHCIIKDIAIDRNKSIQCEVFAPKVKNRPTPEPVYVPAIPKKTRKLIQKLVKAGIVPVAADGTADVKMDAQGNLYRKATIEVPQTTATAGILGTISHTSPTPGVSAPGSAFDFSLPEDK